MLDLVVPAVKGKQFAPLNLVDVNVAHKIMIIGHQWMQVFIHSLKTSPTLKLYSTKVVGENLTRRDVERYM